MTRVQRGVGMCGVGKDLATVECSKVDGPTDAPIIAKVRVLLYRLGCIVHPFF